MLGTNFEKTNSKDSKIVHKIKKFITKHIVNVIVLFFLKQMSK